METGILGHKESDKGADDEHLKAGFAAHPNHNHTSLVRSLVPLRTRPTKTNIIRTVEQEKSGKEHVVRNQTTFNSTKLLWPTFSPLQLL